VDSFFKEIEKKTGVPMEEVFALANAIQNANFSSEKQVRKIVRKVGRLANKSVSAEMEDRIVQSILQDGKSMDISKIQRMMK